MLIIRRMLTMSVVLVIYSVIILSIIEPLFGVFAVVVLLLATVKRKVVTYTAHGTARWADAIVDLQDKGMLNV